MKAARAQLGQHLCVFGWSLGQGILIYPASLNSTKYWDMREGSFWPAKMSMCVQPQFEIWLTHFRGNDEERGFITEESFRPLSFFQPSRWQQLNEKVICTSEVFGQPLGSVLTPCVTRACQNHSEISCPFIFPWLSKELCEPSVWMQSLSSSAGHLQVLFWWEVQASINLSILILG